MHIFTFIAFSGKILKDLMSQLFSLQSGTLTLQPCLTYVEWKVSLLCFDNENHFEKDSIFLSVWSSLHINLTRQFIQGGRVIEKQKQKKPVTTPGTVWELNLEEGQRKGRDGERNVGLETAAEEAPGQSGPG